MIRLFIFPPLMAGTPNPGPFCIKLEMALRLSGLPYETAIAARPDAGPKQKVPFVEIDGERMGDSTLILQKLRDKTGIDLDEGLSPRERAQSHALQRMIEERLYFIIVYGRWMEPENWPRLKGLFFGKLPLPLRLLLPRLARKRVRQTQWGQGIGRHQRDEIYALGRADLDAMSEILGSKPFFFGDRPSLADATAFGFFISIIGPAFDTPLKAHALTLPNLVAHSERMGEIYARDGHKLMRAA